MTYNPRTQALFTTVGQHFWICPPGVNYIDLTLVGGGAGGGGGGGGGGGCGYYVVDNGGGGGGGGGGASGSKGNSGDLVTFKGLHVVPGQTYTVYVGAAGIGGAGGPGGPPSLTDDPASDGQPGQLGGYGGNSSFAFPNGLVYEAYGGTPGPTQASQGFGSVYSSPGNPGYAASDDGQQSGLSGQTYTSPEFDNFTVIPTTQYLYNIYTDIDLSPSQSVGVYGCGPISPDSLGTFLGTRTNATIDISASNVAYSTSPAGVNYSEFGATVFIAPGGAGGVLYENAPIPLYIIGEDISQFTNIQFPGLYSSNGVGLGNGDNSPSSGSTPSSSYICFWSNGGIVHPYGYGAGGLGGPGGGGGYGDTVYYTGTTYSASGGGSGYQGDNGLPGAVFIDWT